MLAGGGNGEKIISKLYTIVFCTVYNYGESIMRNGVEYSSELGVDELVKGTINSVYDKSKHTREAVSIILFIILTVAACNSLYQHLHITDINQVPAIIITCIVGITLADFLSGLVHWTLDSWGSIETPIFGKSILIPSREHHLDPTAAFSDFFVTWGDTCLASSFLMSFPLAVLYCTSPETIEIYFYFILCAVITVVGTSTYYQVHKWAHTQKSRLPSWIKWLQRAHIILPIKHHHAHHQPPHVVRYCLVTGWANYPLDYIDFWRKLEWIIESITGWKPRQDDMKWSKKKQRFLKLKNKLSNCLLQENKLEK